MHLCDRERKREMKGKRVWTIFCLFTLLNIITQLSFYREIMSGKQETINLNYVNINKPNLENINILI
jgi:hypothetical protein